MTLTTLIIASIIVLLVILTIIGLLSRYRKCPSDQLLVVFGKVGGSSAAKNLKEHKSLNTDADRKTYFNIVKFLEKFFNPNDVKKILKTVNKE